MIINVNTKWLKIMNGIARGKNQPVLELNDLIIWTILSQLDDSEIPLFRSIVKNIIGESERTISRRYRTLRDLGLIQYRFYNGTGHYTIKVSAKYDIAKFDARYKVISGENEINEMLKRVYDKMKGDNV